MSPFDTFQDSLPMPPGLADSVGTIMVGFPNEALIADWREKTARPDTGQTGDESLELNDFPGDVTLMVCSAADENW